MSESGYFFNDLTPEEEQQQRALAYAQAIQRQGMNEPPKGAYGGVAGAGNQIVGALLARNANKKLATLGTDRQSSYARALGNALGPSDNSAWDAGPELDSSGDPGQISVSPRVGAPLAQRIGATMNPDLMKQMGPQLIQQQMNARTTLSPEDAAALGYRAGSVVQKGQNGELYTTQPSDTKSPDAFDQEKALKAAPGPLQQALPPDVLAQQEALKAASGPPPQASAGMTPEAEAQSIRINRAGLQNQMDVYGGSQAGGAPSPVVASHVQNILGGNETMQNVPAPLKNAVSMALAGSSKESYSPLAASRFAMASTRIANNFIKLPAYQLTANGLPYLQRIDAAIKTPGSVSDQDLLDSLTKLNTSGNAVTEEQVRLITGYKSFSDMAHTFLNKFENGGALSPKQRSDIQTIAKSIYANYAKGYQPVYDQVTKQLKDAGIPESFWTVPNLNSLAEQSGMTPPSAFGGAGNEHAPMSDPLGLFK